MLIKKLWYDRAFAALVKSYELKKLPLALIEGLEWDQDGRRFKNLSELYSYCARVASSVGVMMCILMNVRMQMHSKSL